MAGSCVPLSWRRPWLEYELGTPLEEALATGYGGIEAYGYHTIETLLCMVERRQGGETGVAAVQSMEGDAVIMPIPLSNFSIFAIRSLSFD